MAAHENKLLELMRENPRLSSRRYAEMALEQGIVDAVDSKELVLRELQKSVRHAARSSKSDPELAFVSLTADTGDGSKEEVYLPAAACTKAEAQRVLDNYGDRVHGLVTRATAFRDYWNDKPFGYQLKIHWG
jgi:hypothetical protein